MKAAWLGLLVIGTTLTACAAESTEGEAIGATEGALSSVPADLRALFEKVDGECAGNDNGRIRTFDPASFTSASGMAALTHRESCEPFEREVSSSRESGARMFLDHIKSPNFDTRACLANALTRSERTKLEKIVTDPTNLGVFASVFKPSEDANEEACSYYLFHVYRRDGVFIELTFNFTD